MSHDAIEATETNHTEPHSDHRRPTIGASHPDATAKPIDVKPGFDVNWPSSSGLVDTSTGPLDQLARGPALPRDRAIVLLLVRLRFLAIAEINSECFAGRHQSVVTRALKRLASTGWITTWDEPIVGGGGSPRWAIPTARAIHWAGSLLRVEAQGQPWETIAALMLPGERAHPLQLARGKAPTFLAHQREVNKLCISLQATFGERLPWISAFDRPFPNTIGGILMPQPDFVLVVDGANGAELIFGEHDRGSESLAHFRRAKVERYAELADFPVFCRDTFGFATFRVVVTVADAVKQKPRTRMATLANCAQQLAVRTNMQFELAGIAHAAPDSLIGSGAESLIQGP